MSIRPCIVYQTGFFSSEADHEEDYGYMVGIVNGKVKKVPLGECAGKLKTVSPDAQEVQDAKRMGISFGD